MKKSELKTDRHNRPIQKSELETKKQDQSMKKSELRMDRHNRRIQKSEPDIDRLYQPIQSEDRIGIGRSNQYRKIESISEDRSIGPFAHLCCPATRKFFFRHLEKNTLHLRKMC